MCNIPSLGAVAFAGEVFTTEGSLAGVSNGTLGFIVGLREGGDGRGCLSTFFDLWTVTPRKEK